MWKINDHLEITTIRAYRIICEGMTQPRLVHWMNLSRTQVGGTWPLSSGAQLWSPFRHFTSNPVQSLSACGRTMCNHNTRSALAPRRPLAAHSECRYTCTDSHSCTIPMASAQCCKWWCCRSSTLLSTGSHCPSTQPRPSPPTRNHNNTTFPVLCNTFCDRTCNAICLNCDSNKHHIPKCIATPGVCRTHIRNADKNMRYANRCSRSAPTQLLTWWFRRRSSWFGTPWSQFDSRYGNKDGWSSPQSLTMRCNTTTQRWMISTAIDDSTVQHYNTRIFTAIADDTTHFLYESAKGAVWLYALRHADGHPIHHGQGAERHTKMLGRSSPQSSLKTIAPSMG